MFALSLPAVKSFKSGLPTSLHLRFFFSLGGGGGILFSRCQLLFIFYNHAQADCRGRDILVRRSELFTLVHGVRLF